MKWRNDDMLLRIAQGDAYAAAVEYVDPLKHKYLFHEMMQFRCYQQHPTHRSLMPGMYTDDTQMSLAIAELLCVNRFNKGNFPTKERYAEWFFKTFKRDPREGYSKGFQKILQESTSSLDMMTKLVPNSNKNGACMRAVPIGVLSDVKDVVRVAVEQARLTHDTPGGIGSSVAVALMSHFSLYNSANLSEVRDWGRQCCQTFKLFDHPWSGPVINDLKAKDNMGLGVGLNTAWAVYTLITEEQTLMNIMRRLINWGGDTDSVAAIAWGIASARYQTEQLPKFLERDLEIHGNINYGSDYLRKIGQDLMNAYC